MSYKRTTEQAKLPKVSNNLTYPTGWDRKKKEYCKRLINQLQEAEIICDLDINLVYRYCNTKFMLDDLDQEIAKVGITDYRKYKELLKMYTSLSTTFISLSKELGMSPRNNRIKSNIDKREVLDTNIVSDDEDINLEGWTIIQDE